MWRRLPDREALSEAWRAAVRGLRQGLPLVFAVLGLVVVLTAVGVGYHFVASSPRFAVSRVEVLGNQRVPASALQSRVGLSAAVLGDAPGRNIFALDLGQMAETLEAEPWIEAATVRRRLPDAVVIEVEENQPVALVELDGLYLVDERGRVFARGQVERGDGAELPVITGIARDDYNAEPARTEARIRRAIEAVELYRERDGGDGAEARPRLGEIHIDNHSGITFFTFDTAMAVRIGHGSADVLRARLRAFDVAWRSLPREERAQVDVVYADLHERPDRVTMRFAEAAGMSR